MELNKIASFRINHNKLRPGLYVSRIDGDVTTYDLRFKTPNAGDYLSNGALHTIEHLFATYARSSAQAAHVIYFGPMGCRTGFYFLTRGLSKEQVIELVKAGVRFVASFEGPIPGAAPGECGNYREHDLPGARREAEAYLRVIGDWTPGRMVYPA